MMEPAQDHSAFAPDTRKLGERVLAGSAAATIAASSAMTAFFDPSGAGFFPACPLYTLTGFACPGCGLTRGFHALFHGEIGLAVGYNALIPIWAVILGYVWLSLISIAVRGKPLPMWPMKPLFLWIFLVVLLLFGILRNLPVYPFNLLYPGP